MAKELTMEQLKDLFATIVEEKIKELGIGQAEVKHGVVPSDTIEKEVEQEKLSPVEKMANFLKAVLVGDIVEAKALGGTVDSEGGFLVPTEFRKEVIKAMEKVGVARKLSRVIKVKSRTGEMPVIGSKPVASWGTDNTAIAESGPTFAQVVWSLKRVAVFEAISRELLADTPVNLVNLLKELFAEAIAKAEDEAVINGDGSTIPIVGIKNNANVTKRALDSALTYDALVDAFFGLPQTYRDNAVFLVGSFGLEVLRKLKDANGNPILLPPAVGGQLTIFGRPVVETPVIGTYQIDTDGDGTPDTTVSDIIIADFKQGYLFDSGEMGFEATKTGGTAFVNHQVLTKMWNRIDYQIALPEAFEVVTQVR